MATNIPLPTFGAQGFQAPTSAQVLAGVQADMQQAFGGELSFTTSNGSAANSTPQGQLAASLTAAFTACFSMFQYITNQMNPAFAEGRMQDGIASIYFLQRYPAQGTVVACVCSGRENTQIPGGTVGIAPAVMAVDEGGNQYTCLQGGTIPAGGSITLQFVNVVPGPTPCPAGTLNVIYQTIPGWDSIDNPADGVVGNDTESRAAFETRRQATVEANSFGPIGAVIGAVANVEGVLDFYAYSNNTGAPVTVLGVSHPANSIYVCVAGGSPQAIADAILSKLNPGPALTGNTTVTAYDDNPLYASPVPYQIVYQTPGPLTVLFSVVLFNNPAVPANAATLVQNAVVSAFGGGDGSERARIGSLLFASRFYSSIAVLGPWVRIVSIKVGSNNNANAIIAGTITGTTLTVISTTSGGIVVGGTISDPLGRVLEGTTVTGGSGSTWTVSHTQEVPGATFTGNVGSPTTRIVVTASTGTIHVGDTVGGTGITNGTTVVSQVSGTPGGNGTYLLSQANSTSSASCTAAATITEATPDRDDLQVNADQVPVTDVNVITVTVVG
jgi:hypothetical protein